jgi:uncharacterized protein YjiS (DUF1127 family)
MYCPVGKITQHSNILLKRKITMANVKKAVNDNTPTFLGRLRKWIEISGGMSALNRLDDRTLSDIGLSRSEIRDFVHSWADRKDTAA